MIAVVENAPQIFARFASARSLHAAARLPTVPCRAGNRDSGTSSLWEIARHVFRRASTMPRNRAPCHPPSSAACRSLPDCRGRRSLPAATFRASARLRAFFSSGSECGSGLPRDTSRKSSDGVKYGSGRTPPLSGLTCFFGGAAGVSSASHSLRTAMKPAPRAGTQKEPTSEFKMLGEKMWVIHNLPSIRLAWRISCKVVRRRG